MDNAPRSSARRPAGDRPDRPAAARIPDPADFGLAGWVVRPSLGRLVKDGREVKVRRQVMDVLVCLACRPGALVSKRELFETVWQDPFAADSGLARCVTELRRILGDSARNSAVIETVPRKGYRLAAPVEQVASPPACQPAALPPALCETVRRTPDDPSPRRIPEPGGSRARLRLPTGRPLDRRVRARLSAAGLAALAVAALWGASSKTAKPAEDVVLVAIENSTGDPVFDRTLPLAVAVQLEKDASVHVLSEERTRELLPAGAGGDGRAAAAARSLCRQTGATAWVTGSIAGGDGDLVLALNAESCRTGEAVFHEVVHLQRPEHVLSRLRAMAAGARRRLGELRMAHGGVGVETRA